MSCGHPLGGDVNLRQLAAVECRENGFSISNTKKKKKTHTQLSVLLSGYFRNAHIDSTVIDRQGLVSCTTKCILTKGCLLRKKDRGKKEKDKKNSILNEGFVLRGLGAA